jgi:hypothetical protein
VTALEVAKRFDVVLSATLIALLNNTAAYWGVGAQRIRPLPIGVEALWQGSAGPGTAGASPMPKQIAGIFSKITAFGGRAMRGRVYVPFPTDLDNSSPSDAPTVGYMTRLGAFAANVVATTAVTGGAGNASMVPVIYHRVSGNVDIIIGATARQKWATQRRRGDYGRPNDPPS